MTGITPRALMIAGGMAVGAGAAVEMTHVLQQRRVRSTELVAAQAGVLALAGGAFALARGLKGRGVAPALTGLAVGLGGADIASAAVMDKTDGASTAAITAATGIGVVGGLVLAAKWMKSPSTAGEGEEAAAVYSAVGDFVMAPFELLVPPAIAGGAGFGAVYGIERIAGTLPPALASKPAKR